LLVFGQYWNPYALPTGKRSVLIGEKDEAARQLKIGNRQIRISVCSACDQLPKRDELRLGGAGGAQLGCFLLLLHDREAKQGTKYKTRDRTKPAGNRDRSRGPGGLSAAIGLLRGTCTLNFPVRNGIKRPQLQGHLGWRDDRALSVWILPFRMGQCE